MNDKENKEKKVTVRYSPTDFLELKKKAESSGKNVARYIRDASLSHHSVQPFSQADFRNLANIGNNLNQLTRDSHIGLTNTEKIQECLEALKAVLGRSNK